jgi:nucleoside-diphosphate-sugar epimerase
VRLWDWITALCGRLDLPLPRRRVPASAARAAGAALEWTWRGLRRPGEPPLTRFVAAQLSTSHSYDMAPLERDLGYRERVGMTEAVERTVAWLRTTDAQPLKV